MVSVAVPALDLVLVGQRDGPGFGHGLAANVIAVLDVDEYLVVHPDPRLGLQDQNERVLQMREPIPGLLGPVHTRRDELFA